MTRAGALALLLAAVLGAVLLHVSTGGDGDGVGGGWVPRPRSSSRGGSGAADERLRAGGAASLPPVPPRRPARRRVHVVQAETRPVITPNEEWVLSATATWARAHGYRHTVWRADAPLAASVPPWWLKVAMAKQFLEEEGDGEEEEERWVLWMDADAMPARPECGLEAVLDAWPHAVFVGGADGPPELHPEYYFNAGVWAVRAGPLGRAVMDAWWAHFRPERWRSAGGPNGSVAWTCPQCVWAGPEYEQGSFNGHVWRHPAWAARVEVVPWGVFHVRHPAAMPAAAARAFTFHFASAGRPKEELRVYRQYLVDTHATGRHHELPPPPLPPCDLPLPSASVTPRPPPAAPGGAG